MRLAPQAPPNKVNKTVTVLFTERQIDMTEKTVKIFPNMYFGLTHCYDEVPDNNDFKLHNHDDVYEIVLFLSGDSEFYAEGNVYKLKPYDMLITRPFEMHHIRCLSTKPYERIILYLSTEYFKQNRCEEFEDIFINRPPGTGNLIPSDIVKDDLLNPINRISVYIHNGSLTAANGVIIEFLYLLNTSKSAISPSKSKDKRISDIIMYINEHLSETITLDFLSEKFFINKYHLCKLFKKNRGYTLSQYINHKRILLVRELHTQGQSLLEASTNAGFNNYSHFYRQYVKKTGMTPKNMN